MASRQAVRPTDQSSPSILRDHRHLVLGVLLACLAVMGTYSINPARAQSEVGDLDGDGVPDMIDLDDDNDTVSDDNEGAEDTDGDGIPDRRDSDSDNDAIPDLIEHVRDLNLLLELDGLEEGGEAFDGLMDSGVAVGNNGLADVSETQPDSDIGTTGFHDSDNDGVRDQLDLDSDNDGITDLFEFGCPEDPRTFDENLDARLDGIVDANNDGLDDRTSFETCGAHDQDVDGEFDFRDTDSDGDGISDAQEAFADDVDADGQVDRFTDIDMDGLEDDYRNDPRDLRDSDDDGLPDHLDLDSNDNGVSDAQEAGQAMDDVGGSDPPGVMADDQPGAAGGADDGDTGVAGSPGGSVADPVELSGNPVTIGREGAAGCSFLGATTGQGSGGFDLLLMLLGSVLVLGWRARHLRRG